MFDIKRLMRTDFSAGTERFEEDLLQKALGVLGQEEKEEVGYLSDDDLSMLSAAGINPMMTMGDENDPIF
ncbi:MAG: hypothetical protein J6D34_07955 [Atopobiaceae bacterium]|nr:hypothetical protein [Atopobiaceae bacterium]